MDKYVSAACGTARGEVNELVAGANWARGTEQGLGSSRGDAPL